MKRIFNRTFNAWSEIFLTEKHGNIIAATSFTGAIIGGVISIQRREPIEEVFIGSGVGCFVGCAVGYGVPIIIPLSIITVSLVGVRKLVDEFS